jgi:hypothetical protein
VAAGKSFGTQIFSPALAMKEDANEPDQYRRGRAEPIDVFRLHSAVARHLCIASRDCAMGRGIAIENATPRVAE